MKLLTLTDILAPEDYENVRATFRDAVIAHKRARRVGVGDKVTLVFEDRETLRWQVQEMVRVERVRDPRLIQHELDVYNELLPGEGELSATLFIEITNLADIKPELDRLLGLDECVHIVLGEGRNQERIPAHFEASQMEEDRLSAVQYIHFRLTQPQIARFSDPAVAAGIAIDHPHYAAKVVLKNETRQSLTKDLRGGCAPLIDVEAARGTVHEPDEILEETERIRVIRPVRGRGLGHRILELRDPQLEFCAAPPETLAEIAELARRHGGEILAAHGSCRLSAELADTPLRWHLFANPS